MTPPNSDQSTGEMLAASTKNKNKETYGAQSKPTKRYDLALPLYLPPLC